MFYLIAGILLALYYIFAVPKTVKGTLNTVTIVGMLALFLVLSGLALIKVIQSPPELFIGLVMTVFGGYVLRDVTKLSTKVKKIRK